MKVIVIYESITKLTVILFIAAKWVKIGQKYFISTIYVRTCFKVIIFTSKSCFKRFGIVSQKNLRAISGHATRNKHVECSYKIFLSYLNPFGNYE